MPKYGNSQTKSFTVTWPARNGCPQIQIAVSAADPARAVTVASRLVHDSLDNQNPTVS